MTRAELIDELAKRLVTAPGDRPFRVALNGPVAVGKSMFAGDLADRVRALGRPVVQATIDRYRLPPSPEPARDGAGLSDLELLYSHVLDFAQFRDRFLLPLGPRGTRRYLHDAVEERKAPPRAIALGEGVLLFHPTLDEHWDLRVYLHCSPSCAIERAVVRNDRYRQYADAEATRENYRTRFLPLLALYEERVDPRARADILIDYEDLHEPRLVRWSPSRRVSDI